jgi:membrane protein implicated in regulation of membrane protease activity
MFTNILGFEAMPTGLEMVFGFCALIGSLLFLLYFGLVLIGGVFEGVVEGMFDIDVDMGSDFSFKAITFQGVVAFVMMFGLVGLAVMQSTTNEAIAVFGGAAAGIMSMFAINKLFHMFYGLESDGTVQHNQAIGAKGLVTTRIRKGSPGEVQVTYQHALRTEAAVCEDENMELGTGTMIEVVDVIGTRLIVKKHGTRQSEEE